MPYKRKPKVLNRKRVMRRTGAKAQSKQIVALSKQVGSLTRSNYETIQTVWTRNELSVDSLTAGINAYVCPIPKSMGNCFNQNTLGTTAGTDQRIRWSDNLTIAAQTTYAKLPVFGSSEAARNSPEATHIGGILKWRMTNQEPSFSTYTIYLLSPKKRFADQLITDRALKGVKTSLGVAVGAAGGASILLENTDYITHPAVMGSQVNRKYFNIDYHREVNFSHPGSNAFSSNVNPANTNTKNNAVIQTGTIKLKPGGVLRCMNKPGLIATETIAVRAPVNASQIGYIDEQNEKVQYLVIINNGVSADLETVNLSLLVKDFYKMVV